ncbi:MAG: ferritin-like domain-containing protein [Candidatus Melainabacteria bacterium]|nr:ferritin-like domain-containing protein [Candidatus Melainabacteria bacterium]
MAYSGELAAAFAYAGHWRSLSDPQQKADIRKIENDEWKHRAMVGEMLAQLNGKPQLLREIMMACIGINAFFGCFMTGWFLPMYFAGRLENDNTKEYFTAANHAAHLGLQRMQTDLLELSEVELQHEAFFRQIVQGHAWLPLMMRLFTWGSPLTIDETIDDKQTDDLAIEALNFQPLAVENTDQL